jgi:U3 small nucleolar RNA-associated protein 25
MENNETTKLSYDFLSSIEIAILYQADILYMQNWEHVEFVMQHCNKLPVADHGTDYSRVHPYFLEQQSHLHRQVLVSSYFNEPVIQSFFRSHAQSHMGAIRLRKLSVDGCISRIHLHVKQIFQKIQCSSYQSQDDEKFQYFCDQVLSQILRLNQSRTLIVAPSYFSYVRLRNELIKREADAAFICEYSRESEISRGRSRFFHGQKKIMLYSGRAHFFRRFELRGTVHVVFYGIPEYPHHYPEIVNLLREADHGGLGAETSTVLLFSQYERMALERLVGKERCSHILESKKSTFIFK